MSEIKRELPREYFERWQRVGPELEKIRRRELRAYDFEKNRDTIASLFEIGVKHAVPRKRCGLIEWSRRLRIAER